MFADCERRPWKSYIVQFHKHPFVQNYVSQTSQSHLSHIILSRTVLQRMEHYQHASNTYTFHSSITAPIASHHWYAFHTSSMTSIHSWIFCQPNACHVRAQCVLLLKKLFIAYTFVHIVISIFYICTGSTLLIVIWSNHRTDVIVVQLQL